MSKRGGSGVSRYLPIVYLSLTFALIAVVLPTALRPPPSQPPSSGALSPDAPPDDQQVLLSELSQGRSTTAGIGAPQAVAQELGGAPAPAPVELRPSKGKCFGNPPRQIESIYAPPCVPAYVGTNPGATWQGVTATEVRWGLLYAFGQGYEGPVSEGPDTDDVVRSWRVWEEYFNKNFELYGRRLRLFLVRTASWRESGEAREKMRQLAEDYKVMGVTQLNPSPPAYDEVMRRGDMMYFSYGWGEPAKVDPMQWTFHINGRRIISMVAELACKQLHGKPVSFAGDRAMHGQERKLGLIEYVDPNLRMNYGNMWIQELRRQCGWEVTSRQAYNWDDNPAGLAPLVPKFRSEGVTTVFCLCDPSLGPVVVTADATNQRYFPEWIHGGWLGIERNATAGSYSSEQWRNSIGLSAFEMNGARPGGQDWYRSYKEVDPDGTPYTPDWQSWPWHHVMHVAGAMQMAGPNLTPSTMKAGMISRWPPRPPDPSWTLGGGYGPTDWNYSKYAQLMWWDANAPRPQSTEKGAYRYPYDGKRFAEGEIPTEPVPWFKEGISQPPEQERL